MEISVTARHLELTPALSEYIRKKVERAQRFFDHLIWAHAILSVEKRRHIAEVVIHASGHTFRSKEVGADLYAAIDLATDAIDKQVQRWKERVKVAHKNRRQRGWKRQVAAVAEPETAWMQEASPTLADLISTRRHLRVSAMTEEEAVRALEQAGVAAWIFINERTRRLSVLYRNSDKSLGLVEAIL